MPRSYYVFSCANGSVDTVMNAAQPWTFRAIQQIQIVAPAAATSFVWTLRDANDVPFDRMQPNGTTVSYETNAFTQVQMAPDAEWVLVGNHGGASAQNITIIVDWY